MDRDFHLIFDVLVDFFLNLEVCRKQCVGLLVNNMGDFIQEMCSMHHGEEKNQWFGDVY